MNRVVSDSEKIELKGTATQIKWAKTIRSKKLADLKKMGVRVLAVGFRPYIKPEELPAIGITTSDEAVAFTRMVARHMMSCPDAQWWIENRSDPIHKWIERSVKICIAHQRATNQKK
jgi:hypothetical protein